MAVKPLKAKKCRNCGKAFQPFQSMQVACSPKCALEMAVAENKRKAEKEAKAERKAIKEAKERVKSRGDHAKDAQTAFNAWVRERDYGLPCISCDTTADVQYCAGHFLTVGARPELRFEPLNVHLQCNRNCNMGRSGNVLEYRARLIKRIGLDKVEWLEGPHDPKHYSIDDLKAITKKYRALTRELKRAREGGNG